MLAKNVIFMTVVVGPLVKLFQYRQLVRIGGDHEPQILDFILVIAFVIGFTYFVMDKYKGVTVTYFGALVVNQVAIFIYSAGVLIFTDSMDLVEKLIIRNYWLLGTFGLALLFSYHFKQKEEKD